jgi:hypothetical protein
MKLPDRSGLTVAYDTEGSGLFVDDGARISATSIAWRDEYGDLCATSTPFDQGLFGNHLDYEGYLPCGEKLLAPNHLKRTNKLRKDHGDDCMSAPNRLPSAFSHLMTWLLRQDLVMHHKKYDCLVTDAGLRNHPETGVDLMPRVIADTQLRQKVLDPEHTSSLKPTSVRLHLGKEIGIGDGGEDMEAEALKPWKGPKDDPRYDLIPWSILGPYARTDALLTLLLFEWEEQNRLDDPDDPACQLARRLITRQEALARTLYNMERRGVGFDVEWCRAQAVNLARLEGEAKGRVPFRPTYPGAQKYFFGPPADGGLGLIPFKDKLTSTGRPQVDEDVVARLVAAEIPGATEFQTLMSLQSAQSKWYTAYPSLTGADGRIRTCYRQGHVVSGRLSVERWQSQAIPHDHQIPEGIEPIRYGFIEDEGYETWEADVSQAEIRVATKVAKCGDMLRAIRAGIDSHGAAAFLMFYKSQGYTLEEAMARPDWDFNRGVVAKRCNLGILYGGGVGAIHAAILKFAGIDEDKDQVREWITTWRQAFPPFVLALDEYADMASKQGWVRLVDGSRRYFSEWEPVHKAFNQRVQGDVAIAVETAMIEFDRLYPGMLLLQIHDSLVARIPRDSVPEVTAAMTDILVRVFERMFSPVPFKADVKPFGRLAYQLEAAK